MHAELVPSISVAALVQKRDAVVERIVQAHKLVSEAKQIGTTTFGERGERLELYLSLVFWSDRGLHFDSERGLKHAVKHVDAKAWDFLLTQSGLLTFMDATAREQWNAKIRECDVPDLTAENIEATFDSLYKSRGEMFERGVLKLFHNLSWDYKTNNPVKLGKRFIRRHLVDVTHVSGKTWLSGLSHRSADELDDITRVFSVVDGKPEPDYRNATANKAREANFGRNGGTMVLELEYVTVKGFKNGNGHVTFKRPDLVDELNRIVAKHHPGALPPTREEA